MGTLRRKSSDRWKLNIKERDTLMTCNYCNGNGHILHENETTYKQKICCFCQGFGFVNKEIYRACMRWKKILAHYRLNNKT